MSAPWWAWAAFTLEAHEPTVREAALFSGLYVAVGLGFAGVLLWWQGGATAGEYLSGYLIEKSLSLDNVFVFTLVFSTFAIPAAYQHRVLFWGVLGAIAMRAGFIAGGVVLLDAVHWIVYVFGGFLVITGVRMARHRTVALDVERNPAIRLVRRVLPVTAELAGPRFVLRREGRLVATPLLLALVAVEAADVVFAIDSIPAIFAVTRDTFVVFTANALAILGLRSLYFLLATTIPRFAYLQLGLSVLLVLAGVKLVASGWVKVPPHLSVSAIALVIGTAVGASLLKERRGRAEPRPA
jgi:tellurite resistance protein TerC